MYEKSHLTLKEITTELQLPASTCYNIVSTLEHRGVIKKDIRTSEYELGLSLMKWGLKVYDNVDIRKIAIDYLRQLVDLYNETASISVFNPSSYESVVIEVVEGTELLRTSPKVGARYPLHVTGSGLCFLASLSPGKLSNYFEHMKTEPLNRPLSEDKVRASLVTVKENGYAVTINELGTNAASVGAGIRNERNEIFAAIGVSGPIERMKVRIPELVTTVRQFANEVQEQLYGQ